MDNKRNLDYETNPLIERLPKHLKQFILPQNYDNYSPVDQAVWRHVMKKNVDYLPTVAHDSYLRGLELTGVSIESIPRMYGMNRILKAIGWAAVAVDGFIPPNAFMEFQAYKVLVIASDIRQLQNIQYTPAPDIIHEAAGHAPIIANPDYAEYLRRLGEIGAKAILSRHDLELYEAVRKLSILKEANGVDASLIKRAESNIAELQAKDVELSEMAQIRNLQWWTVEYGLIQGIDKPRIYGAGLLSSIGESKWCMRDEVQKIPYSIEAAQQNFDITQPQPQLFVTPDFSYLMEVLEEFARGMSLRRGGMRGLERLIDSSMVGTIELSTGLQVSGMFDRMILNDENQVIYFSTQGPTALAFREKELIGHGIVDHPDGFSSPLGKLKNINLAIEDMGPYDLKAYNFYDGEWLSFEFESGIRVKGLNITGIRNIKGKLMLIQLKHCTIKYKDEVLYDSESEIYNMVVGKEIVSAFAGAADSNSFPKLYGVSETLTIQDSHTKKASDLEQYYKKVRDFRHSHISNQSIIEEIYTEVKSKYPKQWLLLLELLEISRGDHLRQEIKTYLINLGKKEPHLESLIEEGIQLIR